MTTLRVTLNGHSWAWLAHLANKYNLQLVMTTSEANFQGRDSWDEVIQDIVESNPSCICEVV